MERKLIVSLLQKDIRELGMITEGFMEMTEYPAVIVQLARQKTEDILNYVCQLEKIKEVGKLQEPIVAQAIVSQKEVVPEKEPLEKNDATEEFSSIEEETARTIELSLEPKEEELTENEIEEEEEYEEEELPEEVQDLPEIVIEEETIEEEIVVDENIEEELKEQVVVEGKELLEAVKEEKVETPEMKPAEIIIKNVVENTDNTIAGAHTNKKIDDIRHAISIGDRFRFQRELFDGNGELLNKTLSKLNQMKDFQEAGVYLQSKFKWEDGNETAESFYQIVRRRFL